MMITDGEIRAMKRGIKNGVVCTLALWALIALAVGLYPFVVTL